MSFRIKVVILSVCTLLASFDASGQSTRNQRRNQPQTGTATPAATPAAQDAASRAQDALNAQITRSVLNGGLESGDDYVPCKFTLAELRSLTAPEIAQTLSAADAELLKQRVIASAQAQTTDKTFSGKSLENFVIDLAKENFDGLTASQALNRIIILMQHNRQPVELATIQQQLSSAVPANEKQQVTEYLDRTLGHSREPFYTEGMVYDVLKSQVATDPTLTPTFRQTLSLAVNQAAIISKQATTANDAASIVDSARQTLVALQRPVDIGCAMSILSWEETHQAYGRLVANEYIAIQVVVRNLNRNQQFVLHDVEFAVNADPTGRLGRFFSGRDKIIVRSLVTAQQNFSPRNLFVHTAQGIAGVMSAAAPVFGGSLVDANGVYSAGFVSNLDKYWKDQSIEQLNLLNDTGFSSTASSQTVVPKSGTVMIVTFIPAKQFEQGWWTRTSCVNRIYVGSADEKGRFQSSWSENYERPNQARSTLTSSAYGIDVEKLLETCIARMTSIREPHSSQLTPIPKNASFPKDSDLFLKVEPKPYKKWSGNSLAIFRELSNTVVSGTHIIQDDQLAPNLSQLTCPTDDTGNLIIAPDKPTLSCTVKGQNLDKYAKLRLRNATDATDSTIVEGSVTVSGDSSTANVSFPTTGLLSLPNPAYNVYGITSKDVEQKTAITLHFDLSPIVTASAPSSVNFSQPTAATVTVSGFHLSDVKSLVLSSGGVQSSPINAALAPASTDTQVAFQLTPDILKQFANTSTPVGMTLNFDTGKQKQLTQTISHAEIPAAAPAATTQPASGSQAGTTPGTGAAPAGSKQKNSPGTPATKRRTAKPAAGSKK